jgi:hypothetical protein
MPKPRKINMSQSEPTLEVAEPAPVVEKKPRKPRTQKIKVNVDEPLTEDIPIPILKRERTVNPWLEHCKSVRLENSTMKYSDILKLAKESYKKVV